MPKETSGNLKKGGDQNDNKSTNRGNSPNDKEQVKYVFESKKQRVKVEINGKSLDTLMHKTDLNDEIIQFYLTYLMSESEEHSKFHFFDTIFHSRLQKVFPNDKDKSFDPVAWQSLGSWLSDVNIFEKDFLIFPVCREKHWTAIIVCYANEVGEFDSNSTLPDSNTSSRYKPVAGIIHLDSLRTTDWRQTLPTNEVRYFLDFEWRKRLTVIKDFFYHNLHEYRPNLPQQTNAHDCGIFMLAYLRAFVKEPERFYRLVKRENDREAEASLIQMVNNSLAYCAREVMKNLICRVCKIRK